jgi:hypothetical protein
VSIELMSAASSNNGEHVDQGLEQVTPVGATDPLPFATYPNVVDWAAARAPLYGAFLTLIGPLVPLFTPFQRLVTVCPLASVRRTVQPVKAVEPSLCTATSAWYPPLQLPVVR